ncbi:hypothetical protein NLU13_4315 [Sarocladium strictum]|uniref:Uncharacterized protein n=1 Tax=Sarocladium strictum TaxID=5046 RepID=A0AA39GIZ9_SARSR|nr:hypothetical protein NLU13_4315 [Sarocladium strictum]
MPNVKKQPEPESGMQRAVDFSQSLLAVPGYADDSLLSVMRYVSKAQTSLRKCDFEEFMAELGNIETATNAATETPAARAEKIKEHRQKAFSKIEEVPELAADFNHFLMNSRRLHRQQQGLAKEKDSESQQ